VARFELVLATLEVAFTDAAKAAVFLGQLFGKIVTKNVLSLKEIKRLVQQYGKVPGHPPQNKLGYEVMKIAFETIRSERGESVLSGMCRRSNVQLNDFHPSRALKQ
jgi:translation initiation factor 4G